MPSAKDRTIRIKATLDTKSPNGHSFAIDDGKGGLADLVFSKDADKMNKDGYYLIEFQLENGTGVDLAFAKDRDKVLWACPKAEANGGCPPDNAQMDTVFYIHPTKKIQDKKLCVINTNMYDLDFVFAFNFLNGNPGGSKYVKYDPGGTNKDGGIDLRRETGVLAFVLGAGVALALSFAAFFAFNK